MPVETFLAAVQASQVGKVRQLTPEEAGVVAAAAARIVPTDHDPGATEAGAIYYIDHQLALSGKRKALYKAGVAQLTRVATELHSAKFVDLRPEQQDAILRGAQGSQHNGWPQSGEFFSALRQDAIDAFYGFGIGWKVVGYSGPSQPVGHVEFGHGMCTPDK